MKKQKSLYKAVYGKLKESVFSNESGYKNSDESFVALDNPNNILKDNTTYYIFAGGTKPFHAGHDMLLTKIINDAKSDPQNAVACFFIGMGNRKGGADQIEITGDQVKKIWQHAVEKRLASLSAGKINVYVEYGGGPVIKVRQIIQAINHGTIKGSRVVLYGDPEDSQKNYLSPTYYKKDESQKSILKKQIDNPDYTGYKTGDYAKSSPHFDYSRGENTGLSVASSPAQAEGIYDVSFPGLIYPETTGERITSGTAMRKSAHCGDVEGFIAGLPEFVRNDVKLTQIYLDEFMKDCKLNEIKRADQGTKEYTSYLEGLMNELQHVKSLYDSRKKKNSRYRKEASKIQDAYSELRRLKRKNERVLNAEKINELVNHKSYTTNVEVSNDSKLSKDDIRNFFKRYK